MINKVNRDDPPGLVKYNFAGTFIVIALADVAAALDALPPIAKRARDELTAWVKQQGYDTQMRFRKGNVDADTLPAPQREVIEAIIDPERQAHYRLQYATATAILMAIIHLESTINVFLHHNFGAAVSDAAEPLTHAKKLALVYGLRKQELPGHINEAIGELVTWRNQFAHGRPTPRPGGLRETIPPRPLNVAPLPRDTVNEMAHLVRHFLTVMRALGSLNTSPDFVIQRAMHDDIAAQVDRCTTTLEAWPNEPPRPRKPVSPSK